MKIEQLVAWVNALRSGTYKQVQGTLKLTLEDNTKSFCALGIMHETCDGWSGHYVTTQTTQYMHKDASKAIITLNDDKGANFNEIADYIEQNKDTFLDTKHESVPNS